MLIKNKSLLNAIRSTYLIEPKCEEISSNGRTKVLSGVVNPCGDSLEPVSYIVAESLTADEIHYFPTLEEARKFFIKFGDVLESIKRDCLKPEQNHKGEYFVVDDNSNKLLFYPYRNTHIMVDGDDSMVWGFNLGNAQKIVDTLTLLISALRYAAEHGIY